ncbi:hypothetical protein GCM10022233_25100 [Streptomyces shaanxiensis]|uniref:Glucose-methanol-choline oxidoreductase N-terminal domain-containing protein n=1 Tax=Streptomyces shaanxiensis TaxID=653357 RepID=A0ABP7UUG9_9ACTN
MGTKDGAEILVRARREVVLRAGAVDSPRPLLPSNIGPKAEALGIPVVHDLPGVGENRPSHVGFRSPRAAVAAVLEQ